MKAWLKRTLIGVFGASVLFGGVAACSQRAHSGGYGWHAMSDGDAARTKARMIDKVSVGFDRLALAGTFARSHNAPPDGLFD